MRISDWSADVCSSDLIAGLAQGGGREIRVGRFQFLQADDIGLRRLQPLQHVGQPAVDVVDVEGGDLHAAKSDNPASFTNPFWARRARSMPLRPATRGDRKSVV